MNRKQLLILEEWLKGPRRKPLFVLGARLVGKSTLIRLFAKKHKVSLIEVNLEKFPELGPVMKSKDTLAIVNQIESLPKTAAVAEDSILFLDEIQAVPETISALRYFYEDMNELPVIAAGSLMEFALSEHSFSMPVGRIEYLHMGPMTFTEFLEALGEDKLAGIIRKYTFGNTIGPVAHKRLLELLRTYFFVGGMPEAVSVFAKSKKLSQVSDVHKSIIDTYWDDFPKRKEL